MYKGFANIRGAPKGEGVGGLQPPNRNLEKRFYT